MQISGIKDHYEAALNIDGLDLFVSKDAFKEIAVRSGIHRDLPTISIHFDDKGCLVTRRIGTGDGKLATLYMNDGHGGQPYTGRFRLIGGNNATLNPHGVDVQYSGVLDAVPWMRQVTDRHIRGTSATAISQLATRAGLRPRVDATNDMMTWLPNRRPFAQYARFIAERGYAGAGSCMLLAVTERADLLYRNLQTIMGGGGGGGTVFGHRGEGIQVLQFQVASKADVYNNSGAYGNTTLGHQNSGQFYELNRITAGQFSRVMSFSGVMAGFMGNYGTRIMPYPTNAGNVFQQYVEAMHQNRRIKSTFGNDVHILTDTASGVELLQKVRYNAVDPMTLEPLDVFTGDYIVTNKVMMVRHGRYWEKLTLTNQGTG